MKKHSTAQQGFTLIELVVVLIILGILAAFAIPRFINISTDARSASINGLAGTLRSTAALVHGLALVGNVADGNPVVMEGTNVITAFSYPEATVNGIVAAMTNIDGFTVNPDTPAAGQMRFDVTNAPTAATCSVIYTEPASAGQSAQVSTPVVTGC